jgi:hypothetical protein
MEKTLKEILEGLLNTLDPSKEVVTESIREDISTKFIEAVTEAVTNEKVKIDEAVAGQMEALETQIESLKESHEADKQALIDEGVEAVQQIDEQFAEILEFTIAKFDEGAVAKLEQCKEAFDAALDGEIEDLCESVEAIIDTKLDEANTEEDIAGLAKLEKLEAAFESMREIFFKDAVLEKKVTESVGSMKEDYDKLLASNIAMAKKLNKIDVDSFLESETEGMKPAMKDYLVERFENAKLADLKEAWEAAQEDFKQLDEENRRLAKKDVEDLKVNSKIDEDDSEDDDGSDPITEADAYYAKAAAGYANLIH